MKLSIIVPVYNGEKYLESSVGSLKMIREVDLEILLINDGSKDHSLEVCRKLQANDSRIQIYDKPNGGIVDARNYGLSHATGEYIAFLDQDDCIVKDGLILALRKIEVDKSDVCFFSTMQRYPNGDKKEMGMVQESKYLEKPDIVNRLLRILINPDNRANMDIAYLGHVWAAVYSNKFIRDNNIRFKKYVGIEDDFLFVLDCLDSSNRISMVKDVGYYWSVNKESTTYRQKYTDGLVENSIELWKYIESIACKYYDETELIYIKNYRLQRVLSILMRLLLVSRLPYFETYKIVQQALNNPYISDSVKSKRIFEFSKRESLIYFFWKNKLYHAGCILLYI